MNSVTPGPLREIRERVVEAHREGTPLRLRGSGTKDFYGERLEGEVLDLHHYCGVIDYEPSELVITARCGTSISQIESLLAERSQFLAFEPPGFGADPTIGGAIAAGFSGPRRLQVGAARDFVLGVKLLNAAGDELRFGGRVMKNVAGFDVSRMLCGSLGILGIITEVSLKVLPRPRCERTFVLKLSSREAVSVFNRWGSLPLPISGAAWVDGVAWVRLSGARAAVCAAAERIGGEPVDEIPAAAFWNALRHFTHAFFDNTQIWRLSLPATARPLPLPENLLIDWGGAVRWYAGDMGSADVRALAAAAGGTATRWRGDATSTRFHPLTSAVEQIHSRLKQRFDPRGVFNRGRLLRAL